MKTKEQPQTEQTEQPKADTPETDQEDPAKATQDAMQAMYMASWYPPEPSA